LFEQGFTDGFRTGYAAKAPGVFDGFEDAIYLPPGNMEQLRADFRRDMKIRFPAGDGGINVWPYRHGQIRPECGPAFAAVKQLYLFVRPSIAGAHSRAVAPAQFVGTENAACFLIRTAKPSYTAGTLRAINFEVF
jgi:hypothetical protein